MYSKDVGKAKFFNRKTQILPDPSQSSAVVQKSPCLCEILSPVVHILSLFGVVPVKLHKEECEISFKWLSKRGILNLIWLCAVLAYTKFYYTRSTEFFNDFVLNGTDFYTFRLVITIQIAATAFIFLCGNFRAKKFVHAWKSLHRAVDNIGMKKLEKSKATLYILPAFIIYETFQNSVILVWSYLASVAFDLEMLLLIPLSEFLVTFIPGLLLFSYVIILSMIAQHFNSIKNKVEEAGRICMTSASYGNRWNENEMAERIDHLRVTHEELAEAVRNFEDAFGIQILAVFCATSFGFVAGVYGLVVFSQTLYLDELSRMTAGYSIGNILAGMRLLFLLCMSQKLMNSAEAPARFLNAMRTKSNYLQLQVDRFLVKLGTFPVRVTCCKIFTLGNCFLAAASSNVVTYVLVLMQFRMDKCATNSTLATHYPLS